MLISAVRVLFFLLLVAAGIWGIFHLIEDQGGIAIQFAGQEYFFPPIHFAALLLIGFAALWLVLRIAGFILAVLRFIDGDETAVSRYFHRSRERRDYLAGALTQLLAQDLDHARSPDVVKERLELGCRGGLGDLDGRRDLGL